MMNNREDQITMVSDCESRESKLTSWEVNFIESIDNHLSNGGSLSIAQDIKLDEVWERVTAL